MQSLLIEFDPRTNFLKPRLIARLICFHLASWRFLECVQGF